MVRVRGYYTKGGKVMTEKFCPKCKGQNFVIFDTCTTTYVYKVTEGWVEPSGEDNDYQEHVRTVCKCDDCGHRWHPKQMEFTIDEI